MTAKYKRKLTAILSADVKGYSRHMGEDEGVTVQTLTSYRETMNEIIIQYRGRNVDYSGDNLLAEFASVLDSVQCAIEIQKELKARNALLMEERRMEFRIGVNIGDVIEEGDRIYGDGVNIAARIESLAHAGGICISGEVYDQIKKKLNLRYEYLGEQVVKNISEPIRVYRILMEPLITGLVTKSERQPGLGRSKAVVVFLSGILVALAVTFIAWKFYFSESSQPIRSEFIEENRIKALESRIEQLTKVNPQSKTESTINVLEGQIKELIEITSQLHRDNEAILAEHKDLKAKLERVEKDIQGNRTEIDAMAREFDIGHRKTTEALGELEAGMAEAFLLIAKLKDKKKEIKKIKLRAVPKKLSEQDVEKLVYRLHFFENRLNQRGDFPNVFKANRNGTIMDEVTGLLWEKDGTSSVLTKDKAKSYADKLNSERFAGYDNWRIPTLEELCSLLESKKNRKGLYIDPIFNSKQKTCWSSDTYEIAIFLFGYAVNYEDAEINQLQLQSQRQVIFPPECYVRVVRTTAHPSSD